MVQGSHDPRLSKKYKAQRLIVLARDGYELSLIHI
jgi:hypothetical protein